jgi:tetratricopeptide (TPR) repeat protein
MDIIDQIIDFILEHKKLLFTVVGGPLIVFFISELWKRRRKTNDENVIKIDIAGVEELKKRVEKLEHEQGKSLPKEKIDSCFIPGIRELEMGRNLLQHGQEAQAKNHLEEAIKFFICAADALPCYETHFNLASTYDDYCDYDNAKENYLKAIQHDPAQPGAYNGLGIIYGKTGDYTNAEKYYKEAFSKTKNLTDQQLKQYWQANALGNLGLVYYHIGRMDKALEHQQQVLIVFREIGDKLEEANTLKNIGLVYQDTGRMEQAMKHHQKALEIDREIRNKLGEAQDLSNLGNVYRQTGQMEQAIEHHQEALNIFRNIGDKLGEANTLNDLSLVYQDTDRMEQAMVNQQEALDIFWKIGHKRGQANVLNNLGIVYAITGNIEQARKHFLQARAIYEEIGAVHLVEETDENLAKLLGN